MLPVLESINNMPVTRSSVLNAKDIDAAKTLLRFHYDMKYLAAGAVRHEHNMSLRGRKTCSMSTRPKRDCALYMPGMYTEEG